MVTSQTEISIPLSLSMPSSLPYGIDLPELGQNILNLGISQNQRLKSDIKDS